MYIDPPYPDNGCNYAYNMRDWEDHIRLAERLHKSQCNWILSSYDIPEIHALYAKNYVISVQSYSGMRTKKESMERVVNKEVLITNYLPDNTAVFSFDGTRQMRMVLEQDTEKYKPI